MAFPYKVGFIGVGNMAQAMVKALVDTKTLNPTHIHASNRSPGKLQKAVENWGITAAQINEQVIDNCDIIVIAVKPQDFSSAIDPFVSSFHEKQIVVSLAAGLTLHDLQKKIPQARVVRAMPNTPSVIQRGVVGYLMSDKEKDRGLQVIVEDLLSPLGAVFQCTDEEQLEALMVSCSSGTGFVFEFMSYFHDWILERGFEEADARRMVVETFLGAAQLAAQNHDLGLEELQSRVTSKKGVTAAGLDSMREFEIERALRYSFEKAALRNRELAKSSN
ncbi:MAG: pyrroline-5-carboxylate reductase [Bdellovibrionaceae bacterium]|nr:pyrroline-5-carboxylate reductase [Pseudobdellovibrionaceae bacterium]